MPAPCGVEKRVEAVLVRRWVQEERDECLERSLQFSIGVTVALCAP